MLRDPMNDTRETATPPSPPGGYPWKFRIRKIAKKAVGVILIVLGFLALVTPLSPGSWLILVGLELLGLRLLLQDRLLAWAERHPNSKFSKIIRRVMRIHKCDPGAKKRWRRSGVR